MIRPGRPWVIAVSAVVVLSVAIGVVVLQRGVLEVRVTDVVIVPDAPAGGLTQVHARLILRNAGLSAIHLSWLTLFAYDPYMSTLFDTFTHDDVQLAPGETLPFQEVANVTGHWSEVGFTVKLFPARAPSWERSVTPDQTVTWTSW